MFAYVINLSSYFFMIIMETATLSYGLGQICVMVGHGETCGKGKTYSATGRYLYPCNKKTAEATFAAPAVLRLIPVRDLFLPCWFFRCNFFRRSFLYGNFFDHDLLCGGFLNNQFLRHSLLR